MITPINLLAILGAYLLGSIPSAVWIGKIFYGIDIREHGSKNAGATNTFRVLGKKAAIPVLLIDIFKGWLAVKVSFLWQGLNEEQLLNLQLLLGVAALLGHIFPIYAGFRGGKGIATLLGIVLAVNVYAALISLLVFLLVFFLTRYVSLSSIISALAFPLVIILILKTAIPSMVIFSLVIFVLVLITHQKNIERLLDHEESKISLNKRNNNTSHSSK